MSPSLANIEAAIQAVRPNPAIVWLTGLWFVDRLSACRSLVLGRELVAAHGAKQTLAARSWDRQYLSLRRLGAK
jgi:hypothetical protein